MLGDVLLLLSLPAVKVLLDPLDMAAFDLGKAAASPLPLPRVAASQDADGLTSAWIGILTAGLFAN